MAEIVLTGGAGFIGSNLLRALPATSVAVFDNFSRGNRDALPEHVAVFEGDIRDPVALGSALRGARAVVHLAAYGSVVESVGDPTANFDINAFGTQCVLEACRLQKVERVVFASTGGALIGDAIPPVDEGSLPRPISPYGASKLCGEAYCHAYAKSYGLRTVALRFANIYGPFSAHKKGAITRFMKALMRGEPITIYGEGTATRDYLHVDDLCRGISKALSQDIAPGEVFHIASGVETSVNALAALVSEVAGQPGHPIIRLPSRPGEVGRNFARFDKAAATLGFEPRVSLREGLASTWAWFCENRDAVLSSTESDN
ncbi:NAD-dependent epimerase/dehydratase family protein [Frateuria sp. GZRR33]|uniref:NAD-dependent epimerase/dehydratase family protein n=1 Tax=Frateuria sp. GZRR33 TaxID=3351535 RepID=UPI003EDC39CF